MERGFAGGVLERVGSFRFRVPAEQLDVWPGDYVLLSSEDGSEFLGQVEDRAVEFVLEPQTTSMTQSFRGLPGEPPDTRIDETSTMVPKGHCEGSGRVLAHLEESDGEWAALVGPDLDDHWGEAIVQAAPDGAVESFVEAAYPGEGALLRVGTLLGVSKPIRVKLIPDGLRRPTGLFGQSGSGKSYALGIMIEELILQTKANVVVLDPNGDFVRFRDPLRELDQINDGSYWSSVGEQGLDEYRRVHGEKVRHIVVLSADASIRGVRPILVRPHDLDARETAAALKLDPVRDEDEYHLLAGARVESAKEKGEGYRVEALGKWIQSVGAGGAPATRITAERLGRRLRNVSFESLRIWGQEWGDVPALVSLLRDENVQAVIIDLSTLDRLERALVSSVVFRTLWDVQEGRRRQGVGKCTVLVLDEAHHMFPGKALFPEQHLTVDWGSRIAGEGRKFGLYLLVSSQLPSKVHEHVLTQCGNVVLMRMVSQSDIDALHDSFSFVPGSLLDRSKWFKKGEGLVIGDIVPAPCLLHFEGRKTQEGGRDLEVDWGKPAIVDIVE